MAAKDDAGTAASTTADTAGKTGTTTATGTATPAPDSKAGGTTTTSDTTTGTSKEPASKDGTATPESKAPEKYSLKLPDGGRIDEHDLATIETIARQQGWTNDEAQARVTEHAAAIDAQSARFLDDTKRDAAYGGARLDDTLKFATRALDKLRPKGTPRGDGFRALLDKSGYGNHIEVVSLLADLGKAMAEDGAGAGGAGSDSGETMDAASLIYGKSAAT